MTDATVTTRGRRVAMLPELEAERLGLADVLETLDTHEWAARSLCDDWTVHEVLAHLVMSNRSPFVATMLAMIRTRGDFEGVSSQEARERARRYGPAELLAQLRETAGLDRKFPLAGKLDPLVDVLVHGQDILRPLGRRRAMPAHLAVPSIDHVWKSPFLKIPTRFAGIRFVATDTDWARGEGAHELRGPVGDLLLTVTGRPAGLAGIDGPALADVTARLAS